MNKEYIQALDDLLGVVAFLPKESFARALKYFYIIEQALQRLEAIDNTKPNKALEELENYLFNEWKQNHVNIGCDYKLEAELDKQLNNLKHIKQVLIKAQEQENILNLIKAKLELKSLDLGSYDIFIKGTENLFMTHEEQGFETIKEMLKND